MERLRVLAALAIGATLASSGLRAQVIKCTDPRTGAVTYTNSGCSSADRSALLLEKQSAEETARERVRAAESRRRVQRELDGLAARQRAERQATIAATPTYAAAPQQVDKTKTLECQKAKRSLDFAQSSITKSPPQLSAALVEVETSCGIDASKYMPPPPPKHHTQVCVPSANMLICN